MAKVTIVIEDKHGGGVSVVTTPRMEDLMGGTYRGHDMTPAQGYAMFACNKLLEKSKENEQNTTIVIPKLLT